MFQKLLFQPDVFWISFDYFDKFCCNQVAFNLDPTVVLV